MKKFLNSEKIELTWLTTPTIQGVHPAESADINTLLYVALNIQLELIETKEKWVDPWPI